MNDEELRAMIRDSLASRGSALDVVNVPVVPGRSLPAHASHGVFPLARGGDDGGACIIEPSVGCTHCGYCVSYGH